MYVSYTCSSHRQYNGRAYRTWMDGLFGVPRRSATDDIIATEVVIVRSMRTVYESCTCVVNVECVMFVKFVLVHVRNASVADNVVKRDVSRCNSKCIGDAKT